MANLQHKGLCYILNNRSFISDRGMKKEKKNRRLIPGQGLSTLLSGIFRIKQISWLATAKSLFVKPVDYVHGNETTPSAERSCASEQKNQETALQNKQSCCNIHTMRN